MQMDVLFFMNIDKKYSVLVFDDNKNYLPL